MKKIHHCIHCGNEFENASEWAGKKYCSNACRQAAHRAYKRGEVPGRDERDTPVEKAIATKKDRVVLHTCHWCGMGFEVDGLHRAKKYCNNACKQAAYRDARRWADEQVREYNRLCDRPKDPEKVALDELKRALLKVEFEQRFEQEKNLPE